jgi:hypothetical protein
MTCRKGPVSESRPAIKRLRPAPQHPARKKANQRTKIDPMRAMHRYSTSWRSLQRQARHFAGRSSRLVTPPNITIVPWPEKCTAPNPQENVWQFMRDNWLSNCVFKSCEDILVHCC